jgi:RimJ/RimL family protein N-acetyltransferase
VTPSFERVEVPGDRADIVALLTASTWPFHSAPTLTEAEIDEMDISSPSADSYWVCIDGVRSGLIRVLDLDEIDDGSPVFDLRIAADRRGRGAGRAAVTWLTSHLFGAYPALHRIEATTRHDNLAMQRVFERCGYRLEGRLRESWRNRDGSRHDSLVFAIVRWEWAAGGDD